MKTLSQIKQEFKNTTGYNLPIYTYDGDLGVIYDWDFLIIDDFLKMGKIDFDLVRWVEVEADTCEEGEEITDAPFVNPENEQLLRVDCAWSPVIYNKSDEYTRQLLVTTNRYYDWTSERSRMIDSLRDVLHRYGNDLDSYSGIPDADLEADEKQERDKLVGLLRDRIESERKSWEETCSQYEDPLGFEEFDKNGHTSDFSNVLNEVFDCGEYCELVIKVAKEFIEK